MSNKEGGYKKPPKHGQFKKGKSGNPKGRPKASQDKKQEQGADIVDRVLFHEKVPLTDKNGQVHEMSVFEAAFRMLSKLGLTGNVRALIEVLKVGAQMKGQDLTRQKAPLPWNDDEVPG